MPGELRGRCPPQPGYLLGKFVARRKTRSLQVKPGVVATLHVCGVLQVLINLVSSDSLFLTKSPMMNTNGNKKQMSERILNHALEIIYLLMGEEYIIVRKNSPHSSIHLLTGEDEWEYLEGHKELYKDVVMENHQTLNTWELPANRSSGEVKAEIVTSAQQKEEPCVRSHLKVQEIKEVHEDPSTDGSISMNMLEESNTAVCSSDEIMEENTNMSEGFQGQNSATNSSKKSTSCEKGNLTSICLSYQCEQETCAPTEKFVKDRNDATCKTMKVKMQESITCSKWFTTKSVYIDHQIQTREKPHTCNECGKAFPYKSSLIEHERTHTGEKPHKCNECGKRFVSKLNLITHQKLHTGDKPHTCNECGKQFVSKFNLNVHQKLNTGEKPHTCNECGKHFTSKSYLVVHQRKHTGEKPHKCNECGKHFAYKSDLNQHQKIHIRGQPHTCPECGKCFTQRAYLLRHQKTHSLEKSNVCLDNRKHFASKTNIYYSSENTHTEEKHHNCT
ncbi:uncharacterized protein LOC142471258 isoform X2 [Ascaphus truei]|uniref:uncharacterized protein LOC142471258 isoform X2 n=1 Tax=Ascaphus truei TaxID=8439 RepID=UPI003F59137C